MNQEVAVTAHGVAYRAMQALKKQLLSAKNRIASVANYYHQIFAKVHYFSHFSSVSVNTAYDVIGASQCILGNLSKNSVG